MEELKSAIIEQTFSRPEFILAKNYIQHVKFLNKKTKNNIKHVFYLIYGNLHSDRCVSHIAKYTRQLIKTNNMVNLYELLTHSLFKCGCIN
jgi:hypothetical protein